MRYLLVPLLLAVCLQGSLAAADSKPTVVLDDQQRVLQVTVADGHAWQYARDEAGRINTVVTGNGERWALVIGPDGTITAIISPKGILELTGATAVWNDLQLVLKRPGKPDQVLLSDPRTARTL